MGTNQLTEEQLKVAFCEVRKAHRLIYEYQRRMRDLSTFIRNKLGFNAYEGYKRFSNALSNRDGNNADKSSWDWIYTYVFEYWLGYQKVGEDRILGLSVIQVSDTGCYKEGKKNSDISTFPKVEDSDSRLMFYLCVRPNEAPDMNWNAEEIIAQQILKDKPECFRPKNRPELVKVTYSVPLSKFVDEEATTEILREFVNFCNKEENAGTNLEIQE